MSSHTEGTITPESKHFKLSECGWKVSLPPALVLPVLLSNDGFAAYECSIDVQVYKDGVSSTGQAY